jgi:caffeoyl-CoA O-methyltransferase
MERMDLVDKRIEDYVERLTQPLDEVMEELERVTLTETAHPNFLTGRVEGALLRMLVKLVEARTVVEVGTYTGFSALAMASALPRDGRLYTLDIDPNMMAVAQSYFSRSPQGDRIVPVLGDARRTVQDVPSPIDMAFIDADKASYDLYYEVLLAKLRPGGLVVLDNMLWYGSVLDPRDKDSEAIEALNRKIARDERVEAVLLTVRDGVQVVRKRSFSDR